MCNHHAVNPGIPAAQFDNIDSDEDAPDCIEDEHHVIFSCSGYVCARQSLQDLFSESISTVRQFLSQPQIDQVKLYF